MNKTPRTDAEVSCLLMCDVGYAYEAMVRHAEMLECELAAEQAKQAWQPIATAPKDGTRVILWDGCIRLAAWRTTRNSSEKTEPCWIEVDCEDCFYNEYVEAPTHWLSLPQRPPS